MRGVASLAAVMLAGVFAWAAVAKLWRHRPTVAAFTELGLPVPAALAVAVPVVEVAVALVLVVRPSVGAALALALLGALTLVVIRGVSRGAACGCFGSRAPEPVTPADVVRNGLLAAFAALATGTARLVVPGPAAIAVTVGAVVAAAALHAGARRRLAGA